MTDAPVLAVAGARKRFDAVVAVDGVDLELAPRETVALLGPSGCGKTTLLRLIAGLERLDDGRIELGGRAVSAPGEHVPPERRRLGMVFQDYALFPHLDVAGNVGYALGRRPDRARVAEVLELVGLAGDAGRAVHELSGGQQQRVALARALAATPDVVLLDEPFSNLDAGLRQRLREEVRDILREAGVSALFVTHDQEEALSLADRVALMNAGRIEQTGTPEEVYLRPATRWAARFLGEVELLEAEAGDGIARCELGTVTVDRALAGAVDLLVRPESFAVDLHPPGGSGGQAVPARIVSRRFYGHDQMLELELPSGRRVRSRRLGFPSWHPGDRVHVWIDGPVDVLPAGR